MVSTARSRFDLVIFDCDGVIVDSEAITHRVFGEMLHGLGLQMSAAEMCAEFVGRSLENCFAVAEQRLRRAISKARVDEYRARRGEASRGRSWASRVLEDPLLHCFEWRPRQDARNARRNRPAQAVRRPHLQRHRRREPQTLARRLPLRSGKNGVPAAPNGCGRGLGQRGPSSSRGRDDRIRLRA